MEEEEWKLITGWTEAGGYPKSPRYPNLKREDCRALEKLGASNYNCIALSVLKKEEGN
jgi:hypothetical protein